MNWGRRRVVNNGVAIQLLSLNAYVYSMGEFRIDPTLNIYAIIGAEPFCTFWQQSSTYSLIEKKLYSSHRTGQFQLSYLLYYKICCESFWGKIGLVLPDVMKILFFLNRQISDIYLDFYTVVWYSRNNCFKKITTFVTWQDLFDAAKGFFRVC